MGHGAVAAAVRGAEVHVVPQAGAQPTASLKALQTLLSQLATHV